MQKFLFLSVILRGDDMIKFYFLLCAFAIFLIFGCGDNDSNDFPSDPGDNEAALSSSNDNTVFSSSSSSSVIESSSTSSGQAPQSVESDGSSSSEKAVGGSSSCGEKSSSSSGKVESSSSGKGEKSSSSEGAAGSSSSDVVAGSSSSVKSSSNVAESSSSAKGSSSEEPSSSSVVESSSNVAESSSNSEISSSSQQNTVLDSSFYNAEENTLMDFRDGQIYKTVSIGNQIWMAQDLKIKEYGKKTIKSYCYEDNPQNCDTIGRLYIRSAAFDSIGIFGISGKGCGNKETTCSVKKPVRGICPKNWHIADSLEWVHLFNAIDKNKLNLMATYGWDESCYENPTNGAYGFNALPGYRNSKGKYINDASEFWVGEGNVRSFSLSCYWESALPIIRYPTPKSAFSVRCLKDSE